MMREENVIIKTWNSDSLKIALIYPNLYSAMAGLTVQTLYSLWNSHDMVICERFFLPDNPSTTPKGNQIKPILSLENKIPLNQFDILAFTFSYELDYPHLLWFLDNAHIPFYSAQRKHDEDSNFPVIIAGGASVRSNPLPILPFVDAVFIGEIEPVNELFISAWLDTAKDPKITSYSALKSNFLRSLSQIPGFWCSSPEDLPIRKSESLNNSNKRSNLIHVTQVLAENLDKIPHPLAQIKPRFSSNLINKRKYGNDQTEFPTNIAFTDSFFLEIARGCPHICHFCMTGNQIKPYRMRSFSNLKDILIKGKELTDFSRVALIGSSVTDHPDFPELANFIVEQGWGINVPSIRIDKLTEKVALTLKRGGMKTVTVAPETGSDSLREKINKHLKNRQILEGARLLHQVGISSLKIYLLVGLPQETEEDIDQLLQLIYDLGELGFGKGGIKVSLNPFVPKPHTPFEMAVDEYLDPKMEDLKQKIKKIERAIKGNPRVQINSMSIYEAYVQAVLALGDEKFAELLVEFYKHGLRLKDWYRLCTDFNKSWAFKINKYLRALKELSFGYRPWNKINRQLSPLWLQKQWERSNN